MKTLTLLIFACLPLFGFATEALAYKVGQLKIRELRNLASTELDDKFDVRTFHDEVLKHGSLPMSVLEQTVKDWIAAQKQTQPTSKVKTETL